MIHLIPLANLCWFNKSSLVDRVCFLQDYIKNCLWNKLIFKMLRSVYMYVNRWTIFRFFSCCGFRLAMTCSYSTVTVQWSFFHENIPSQLNVPRHTIYNGSHVQILFKPLQTLYLMSRKLQFVLCSKRRCGDIFSFGGNCTSVAIATLWCLPHGMFLVLDKLL